MKTTTTTEWKAPKKRTSDKVCPNCSSRVTKRFSINTGLYKCQECDHEYPSMFDNVK